MRPPPEKPLRRRGGLSRIQVTADLTRPPDRRPHMVAPARFAVVGLVVLIAAAPTAAGDPLAGTPPAVNFARDVWPVLRRACADCHGPDKQKGKLRLDSRAAVLKGGESGPAVVPGKPDA